MLLTVLGISGVLAISHAPTLTNCRFHLVTGSWEGSCGQLFGQSPMMTIAAAKSITTGVWRKGVDPTSIWAGGMTDPGYPDASVEIEIYAGGSGVLRTEYGWFPVSGFVLVSSTLRFQVDASHEVPPSELDRQVVRRAAAILSSASTWNRADNRQCPAIATTWSIYCAMHRATVEVTGAFHPRRPALEVVRQIVETRTVGRKYHHRLMDYNNDPSTRFDEVGSLFVEALARMNR